MPRRLRKESWSWYHYASEIRAENTQTPSDMILLDKGHLYSFSKNRLREVRKIKARMG